MSKLRFDGFYMCIREFSTRVLIFLDDKKVVQGDIDTYTTTVPVRDHLQRFEKRFNSNYFDDLNWDRRSKFPGDSYYLGCYSLDSKGNITIKIIDEEFNKNTIIQGIIKKDSLDLSRNDRSQVDRLELFEFVAYSDSFLQS